jgi:hypothetical protein
MDTARTKIKIYEKRKVKNTRKLKITECGQMDFKNEEEN